MATAPVYRRISLKEARKRFNRNQAITLCPCNLRPGPPFAPDYTFLTGCIREWKRRAEWYRGYPALWMGSVDATAWHLMYNNWKWSNSLDEETGLRAAFYIVS